MDWVGLVVCGLFTVAGVILFVARHGELKLLWPILFFGFCTVTAVRRVRAKRAWRRAVAAEGVRIAGGVPIWLDNKRLLYFVAGAAFLVGTAMAEPHMPRALWAGAWLLAAGCLAVVVNALVSRPKLQFDSDGLRVWDRRTSFFVRWDNVRAVSLGNVLRLIYVAIRLHGTAEILDRSGQLRPRLEKMFARNLRRYGCEVWIHPDAYGLDAVLFVKAVQRYASDAGARAELAPRARLR